MTIQPNNLPQSTTVPYPSNTPAAQNALVPASQSRSNQNWTLKLSVISNTQTLTDDTLTDIGFDTTNFNTYKAITTSVYRLAFIDESLSGFDYPFVSIILPQYGTYDIRSQIRMDPTSTVPGSVESFQIFANYNGGTVEGSLAQTPLPVSGGILFTSSISQYIIANAGDQLTLQGLIVNDTSSITANVDTGEFISFLEIRYMGLS